MTKSFSFLSPMTYTVELYFKRLMSKNSSELYFVEYFKFNKGEKFCESVLIFQTFIFLISGWYAMWWKTKYRYWRLYFTCILDGSRYIYIYITIYIHVIYIYPSYDGSHKTVLGRHGGNIHIIYNENIILYIVKILFF